MMRFLIVLSFLSVVLSCRQELEKPDDLIPRDEMKTIIKEIYVYKNINQVKPREEKEEPAKINLEILKQHNISLERFKSSYEYYVINNAAYDELLKEIKKEIQSDSLASYLK